MMPSWCAARCYWATDNGAGQAVILWSLEPSAQPLLRATSASMLNSSANAKEIVHCTRFETITYDIVHTVHVRVYTYRIYRCDWITHYYESQVTYSLLLRPQYSFSVVLASQLALGIIASSYASAWFIWTHSWTTATLTHQALCPSVCAYVGTMGSRFKRSLSSDCNEMLCALLTYTDHNGNDRNIASALAAELGPTSNLSSSLSNKMSLPVVWCVVFCVCHRSCWEI